MMYFFALIQANFATKLLIFKLENIFGNLHLLYLFKLFGLFTHLSIQTIQTLNLIFVSKFSSLAMDWRS